MQFEGWKRETLATNAGVITSCGHGQTEITFREGFVIENNQETPVKL